MSLTSTAALAHREPSADQTVDAFAMGVPRAAIAIPDIVAPRYRSQQAAAQAAEHRRVAEDTTLHRLSVMVPGE